MFWTKEKNVYKYLFGGQMKQNKWCHQSNLFQYVGEIRKCNTLLGSYFYLMGGYRPLFLAFSTVTSKCVRHKILLMTGSEP